MENHIFTWDGSIKKQSKGGAIGSDLTGELAPFDIPDWEMHMLLSYYIDDGNLIVDPLLCLWEVDLLATKS